MNVCVCLYAVSNAKIQAFILQENALLSSCIDLLKPFENITKETSKISSSLADIIPLITTLKKLITVLLAECQEIMVMRETLFSEINKRFNLLENNDLYAISTFLDSRYKMKFFPQDFKEIIKFLITRSCEGFKKKLLQKGKEEISKRRLKHFVKTSTSSTFSDVMNSISSSSSDNDENFQSH